MNALATKLPRAFAVIERGMTKRLHVGAQVYVSREGEILVDEAIGFARLTDTSKESLEGIALTRDDLVLWLSACKPVGAVAIAQLWEQHRIDIDQPVAATIPEFGQHGKNAITLRHILTHTGGFRTADLGEIAMPWEECIRRVCESPLEDDWIPGERAAYHDRPSWYILAEIVQRVSGLSYPEYVRAEIFQPLGCVDSWVGMPGDRYDAYGERVVPTYDTSRGNLNEQHWHSKPEVTHCWPAGNGRGPIRELGSFYEALLNGGTRDGNEILQPETVNEIVRRHRVGMMDETFRHTIDWGLGFIVNSAEYGLKTLPYSYGAHASAATFGHGGRQSTVGFADPNHRLVVAVAFNGMPGEPKHNQRIREFTTALYEDLGLGT